MGVQILALEIVFLRGIARYALVPGRHHDAVESLLGAALEAKRKAVALWHDCNNAAPEADAALEIELRGHGV